MLFPYQYVPHSMEKMQGYINYIFYEVWCKAPQHEYDPSLFDGNIELQEIIHAFHNTEPKGADFFIKGIQEIYLIFQGFSDTTISILQDWYEANNNIEALCHNELLVIPATYDNIRALDSRLSDEFKKFYSNLYSNDFLSLKVLAEKIGAVSEHYRKLQGVNKSRKCPFCGLSGMESEYSRVREPYDHYLPKSKYPFSSINFRNLAPACHKCNSGYKTTKDPLRDRSGNRRKCFYIYQSQPHQLEISLQIHSQDMDDIKPQDIAISFGPHNLSEEILTWKEIFGVEERYKNECCVDYKDWLIQISDFHGNMAKNEFAQQIVAFARSCPYTDANFLKRPFLEACDRMHLFD